MSKESLVNQEIHQENKDLGKTTSRWRRTGASIFAAMVIGSGYTDALADLSLEKKAIVATSETFDLSDKEKLRAEVLSSIKTNYDKKIYKLDQIKEELKKNGCQDINLDFCAGLVYATDNVYGFNDPDYDLKEKGVLKNYLTREQIFKFGKTGEGLDVIYFKDEKGKKTNEPAICYVVNPELKKYKKIDGLQKTIDKWEKVAPGFLRAMVANDVRVFFHSQSSSDNGVSNFKYSYGVLYYNFSRNDDNYSSFMFKGMAVDQFGVRGDALGGKIEKEKVAAIKQWLARDCYQYIGKVKNKDFTRRSEGLQLLLEHYMTKYKLDYDYISSIVDIIKEENLMTPFGADTWQEIDSIKK